MDSLILTNCLTNVFLDKSLFGFAAINDELAAATSCKSAIVTLMPYPDLKYIYNPVEYFQMLEELRIIHGEKLNEIKKFLDINGVKYASPPASPKDDNKYLAEFSYKWAAIYAGLGFIGKNDVFVHEKYAQRVRISCLLVDLALPVYTGKVKSKCGTCDLCVRACPHHFISGRTWSETIFRGELIDYYKCALMSKHNGDGLHYLCSFCALACQYPACV